MSDKRSQFLNHLAESLSKGTFIKLILGNYKGAADQLQKISGRMVSVRNAVVIQLVSRYATRDETKNLPLNEAVTAVELALDDGFRSARLFTADRDHQLELKPNGNYILSSSRPTQKDVKIKSHDREKKRLIDVSAGYLQSLGITSERAKVYADKEDKWRQINKFVEIIDAVIRKKYRKLPKQISVIDMGSGKGYLTFALYDHIVNNLRIDASIVGVESRPHLVDLCNEIAVTNSLSKLKFKNGNILDTSVEDFNIVIALHACDTATDEAIFKGMRCNADIIIAAPCCHKELRSQITPPPMLADILKHGTMLERTAETLTDGIRAMILEREGYSTRIFEFISPNHTPKNNMVVGLKGEGQKNPNSDVLDELFDRFGIREQRLRTLIEQSR